MHRLGLYEREGKREHGDKSSEAYEEIDERTAQYGAEVFRSHITYKIKTEEDTRQRLKASIGLHSSHDTEK